MDHWEGNPEPDFVIKQDLYMVGAEFLELNSAKEMDIRCVGVQVGE